MARRRSPFVNVSIENLPEIQQKLDNVSPLLDETLRTEASAKVLERTLGRRGKGLGARVNELTAEVDDGGARVFSTLADPDVSFRVNPRRSGSAWLDKNFRAWRGMLPRVIRKTVARMREGWGR